MKFIIFLLSLSKIVRVVCEREREMFLGSALFALVFPVEMSSVTFFLSESLILF